MIRRKFDAAQHEVAKTIHFSSLRPKRIEREFFHSAEHQYLQTKFPFKEVSEEAERI
jgi:hypothetical protein